MKRIRKACVLVLPVASRNFLDMFVFRFARADRLAAGGGDVEVGEVGGLLLFSAKWNGCGVADFLRELTMTGGCLRKL
jgi:hypothetical protein